MGDRENKKNDVYNAKTNAVNNEVAIYDSIDIKDESENQNNTKGINTDETDEVTKVETGNVYKRV